MSSLATGLIIIKAIYYTFLDIYESLCIVSIVVGKTNAA